MKGEWETEAAAIGWRKRAVSRSGSVHKLRGFGADQVSFLSFNLWIYKISKLATPVMLKSTCLEKTLD